MKRLLIGIFLLAINLSASLRAEEAPATMAAEEETMAAEQATAPAVMQETVARAVITSGISDREPIDELVQVGNDVPVVYFFTELRDLQGEHITHRWEHDGQVVAEVGFDVKGPRWRVWSSKKLPAGMSGSWKVHVVNNEGEVLATRQFTCGGQ